MTPISAIGRSERGFTLVEVMVGLLVVGLLTGAVLMTLPPPGPRLADEAERLAGRLAQAREEALATNRPVEVALDTDGYGFRVLRLGAWTSLSDEPAFRRVRWPDGLTARVETADGRDAVRFDSTGAAEPAVVRLATAERRVAVSVDAQGEVRVDDRAK